MAFGDFNNDNKYPDIAVIGSNQEGNDIYNKYYTSFSFLHAGSERLNNYNFKEFYPFIQEWSGIKISENKSVNILNIKDWSGWIIEWNGRRYDKRYENQH